MNRRYRLRCHFTVAKFELLHDHPTIEKSEATLRAYLNAPVISARISALFVATNKADLARQYARIRTAAAQRERRNVLQQH